MCDLQMYQFIHEFVEVLHQLGGNHLRKCTIIEVLNSGSLWNTITLTRYCA